MSFSEEFEAGSSASLSLSRQQFKDTTALSAGIVALADAFADWTYSFGVTIADALGVEPPPPMRELPQVEALRLRSMQQSRASQLAAMQEEMAANKLAAMRAPKAPPFKPREPQWHGPPPTATDKAFERDALLAGGQAAQHAAMANAGPVFDGDAKADLRPIRTAMYAAAAKAAIEPAIPPIREGRFIDEAVTEQEAEHEHDD